MIKIIRNSIKQAFTISLLSLAFYTCYGQTIDTFAGEGTAAFADGSALSAKFFGPGRLCLDHSGNLLIADTGNHRIRQIDANGNVTTIAGTGIQGYSGNGGPATDAQLNTPTDVVVNSLGDIFIADYGNSVVRKIDYSSKIISEYFLPANQGKPMALAIDQTDRLYVFVYGDYYIWKENTNGNFIKFAGDGTPLSSGNGGAALGAAIGMPYAMSYSNGYLFFADNLNYQIRKINVWTGIIYPVINIPDFIYDIEIDAVGNLLMPTWSSVVIRYDGSNISRIAGSNSPGFSGDGGLAFFAQLLGPGGVCIGNNGEIYIGDTGNNRIRIVKAQQSIAFDAPPAGHYGDTNYTFSASASSGLPVTFASSNASVATIAAGNVITFTGIGTTIITAIQDGNAIFDAANPVQQNLVVVRGSQTITFDPVPDHFTTDADFNINATASSGLDVSLYVSSGPATISGNLVSLDGTVGTVTITAMQLGNSLYEPAPETTRSFEVTENPILSITDESLPNPIDIFPIPSLGDLTLKAKDLLILGINIVQPSGTIMYSENLKSPVSEFNINTDLVDGIYFLQVLTDKGKFVKRILISK